MMGGPDDIPQDVWDAAYDACFRGDWSVVEEVARAILAAKAEARDGIADMADAYADVEDISAIHAQSDNDNLIYRTRETTLRAFGAAVRTLNDDHVSSVRKNSEVQ